MKNITAGGGVLFREKNGTLFILMIFRRGVWDLPKGKQDEGENIEECAVREVQEEVGCEKPRVETTLNTTYHEYRRDGEKFRKTTHWYAMTTEKENDLTPQKEEDIERVEWVPLAKAKERTGFENLISVLESFERWYNKDIR